MGSTSSNSTQTRADSRYNFYRVNQNHRIIMPNVKLYFAKDEAGLKNFADVTLQAALGQLEKKLIARGGQYFVGNNLTWADLHVYMYATDGVDKAVLAKFPKLANLVERVGNVPNIKTWVESRPKTDL